MILLVTGMRTFAQLSMAPSLYMLLILLDINMVVLYKLFLYIYIHYFCDILLNLTKSPQSNIKIIIIRVEPSQGSDTRYYKGVAISVYEMPRYSCQIVIAYLIYTIICYISTITVQNMYIMLNKDVCTYLRIYKTVDLNNITTIHY